MQLRALLAIPAVAAVLGFLIGAVLIAASAWSRNLSTSSDARDGLAIMMMFMMGGMLVASGVLIGYVLVAPGGFLFFGLSLGAGYVIGLGVSAVWMMRESYHD
ncbi:MAG: hypothetical protein P4L93_02400 [Coriobacteriia bacterium]|nr:hypothetical protein [Coriobacteriia bacterium]